MMAARTTITLVHFNDVYNVESRTEESLVGAARFKTAMRKLADRDPLILFSGDALNPSVMSIVTHGRQMAPVLNAIGVHCAVYGNHEFDHGVENLVQVSEKSNFPWLLSNLFDISSKEDVEDLSLANGKVTHVITWHGKKFGFIGLVEKDWIATLSTIDEDDLEYKDFVSEGRRLARKLREEEGVDYVIALTHMLWKSDKHLAENVTGIDLILGGHDHDYGSPEVNGIKVVKSGTDFRNYSVVTLTFENDGHVDVDVQLESVDSIIPEDEEMKGIVEEHTKLMAVEMEIVLGYIDVDLDGRFEIVRRQESNLGDFITNIMLNSTEADVAILNSGVMRSDRIHRRGEFKIRDVMSILPIVNSVVVLAVTGTKIVAALENGVSKYPELDGCFPQVGGISFAFDHTKPPGERVVADSVMVGDAPVDLNKTYHLCTNDFVAKGRDGYRCLADCEVIMNEDDGPKLATIVQNHFQSVSHLTGQCKSKYSHHQSIISRLVRRTLLQQTKADQPQQATLLQHAAKDDQVDFAENDRPDGRSHWKAARIALAFTRHCAIKEAEERELEVALAPKLQHRIKSLRNAAARE